MQLLAVHLTDDQGALSGTYEIPELGFFNLPIKELVLADNTIQLKLLYGTFHGIVHEGIAEIAAVAENRESRTSLHLKRSPPEAALKIARVWASAVCISCSAKSSARISYSTRCISCVQTGTDAPATITTKAVFGNWEAAQGPIQPP